VLLSALVAAWLFFVLGNKVSFFIFAPNGIFYSTSGLQLVSGLLGFYLVYFVPSFIILSFFYLSQDLKIVYDGQRFLEFKVRILFSFVFFSFLFVLSFLSFLFFLFFSFLFFSNEQDFLELEGSAVLREGGAANGINKARRGGAQRARARKGKQKSARGRGRRKNNYLSFFEEDIKERA